ncbi:AAA family ATPase [Hymenobacter actinosclerus]|uniref:AAA domain (Dynein-related subfamily) n=1 Tax=Hymenobacter actinosclerus TaxID=82805 RepID=A0A1I0ILX2_9BACT|nr:AAA family ATPase [Hymenobacter actinosclerus]SET97797.1 AAA domain (dynein-related subfamily) [Hymenobacter actinosclerus]
MPALRRINTDTLQQLKNLLVSSSIPVQSIQVAHKNYSIRNGAEAANKPLVFSWTHGGQTEPLLFSFHTWGTVESKKFPNTFLALGTGNEFRMVGFPLYLLPQDKDFVYLSFKLGNNEGGKNRWFGRGRTPKELRTAAQTDQLNIDIRQALQRVFPAPLFKHPTLSGEWLTLARLPVADLNSQADLPSRVALKTLILEKLLHAFVIAEKLRDDSLKIAGMNPDLDTTEAEDDLPVSISMHQPLNQILYGPPGTGKTYHTALRAIGLLERLTDAQVMVRYSTREEIRLRYDMYQQAGRIQFITFHQAFSYEDFIEGIKPVLLDTGVGNEEVGQELSYTIADGIFKVMAQRSVYALHLQQQQRLAASIGPDQVIAPDFDTVFERFIDQLRERLAEQDQILFYTKHNSKLHVDSISESGTIYFRYANGNSVNLPQVTRNGLRKINNDNPVDEAGQLAEADLEVKYGRDRSVYWAAFREFVQFRAQIPTDEPVQVAPQNLDEALQRVIRDPKIAAEITQEFDYRNLTSADFNAAPRMVLIIDEINRGNVASIFGELITLLEDGKRAGRPERLTARLPYSKTDFTVPPNLFLLGTMNTADRSVEALDTALRRRFSFTEMQPEPAVIRAQVGSSGVIGEGAAAIDVARILEVLNSRLEQLLDHDHCLGHALLLLSSPDVDSLRTAFERNIVPLLQEYFFGDWGKIGLVLGEKFVTAVPRTGVGRDPLAKFAGYDSSGLHDRPLYRLTAPATWDVVAFQSLYPATA